MPPQFNISIDSVKLPSLPQKSIDETIPGTIRSPLIPSSLCATTPLCFTCHLSLARPKDPLYPATHLQLSYNFHDTGEVFIPRSITSERLIPVEGADQRFEIQIPVEEISRAKVNHGATTDAQVAIYAWKGEKMLGKWIVCKIEGLGVEGLKSNDLAMLRVETWKKNKEAAALKTLGRPTGMQA